MSPEQCVSKEVDRRSDVFSLGVVLYELLTLRRLYKRSTALATLKAITEEPVVPPSRLAASCPKALDAICLRALAHDPGSVMPLRRHAPRLARGRASNRWRRFAGGATRRDDAADFRRSKAGKGRDAAAGARRRSPLRPSLVGGRRLGRHSGGGRTSLAGSLPWDGCGDGYGHRRGLFVGDCVCLEAYTDPGGDDAERRLLTLAVSVDASGADAPPRGYGCPDAVRRSSSQGAGPCTGGSDLTCEGRRRSSAHQVVTNEPFAGQRTVRRKPPGSRLRGPWGSGMLHAPVRSMRMVARLRAPIISWTIITASCGGLQHWTRPQSTARSSNKRPVVCGPESGPGYSNDSESGPNGTDSGSNGTDSETKGTDSGSSTLTLPPLSMLPPSLGPRFAGGVEPGDPSKCEATPPSPLLLGRCRCTERREWQLRGALQLVRSRRRSDQRLELLTRLHRRWRLFVLARHLRAARPPTIPVISSMLFRRAGQGGTRENPTVIKSCRGSPRAVFDGQHQTNDMIVFAGMPSFRVANLEIRNANGRGVLVESGKDLAIFEDLVVHDTVGDGVVGVGGGLPFFWRRQSRIHHAKLPLLRQQQGRLRRDQQHRRAQLDVQSDGARLRHPPRLSQRVRA